MISNSLLYITIKTQVRRIKYFTVALKYLSHVGLQKQILNEMLLKWSKSNHSSFESYISPSGEISLSEGKTFSNSLKAYYHALKEFNLIIEQGNFVLPTKRGEVLIILLDYIKKESTEDINSYSLNCIEQSYFLTILFESDYDIIFLTLQMLNNFPSRKLDFYLSLFQEAYLKRLEHKLVNYKIVEGSNILETKKRVLSWRSPKRYSEELMPPRLNWLIDLNLVRYRLNNGYYELTSKGKYFFETITTENSSEREYFTYDVDFSASSLISIISTIYFNQNGVKKWSNLIEHEKEDYAMEGLAIATKYFCVLGIPRMPANSTILLCSLYLLNKYSVCVNFLEFSSWIGAKRIIKGKHYGFRSAAREGESYIVVTNE